MLLKPVPTRRKGGAYRLIPVQRPSVIKTAGPTNGGNGQFIHRANVSVIRRSVVPTTNGVHCTYCGGILDELEFCGRCGIDHLALRTGT